MVGRLFNSVLIDKLKFYIPNELLDILDKTKFINKTQEVLSKYYAQEAFHISTSRNRMSIEFTPTRYRTDEKQTDTNLVMPDEATLHKLFIELGFYDLPENIYNSFIISKLHITKNIYTEKSVSLYIRILGYRNYQNGIKPICNTSNTTNSSLILSNLKKDYSDKNIVGNKLILFYDKVQELKDKASLNDIYLREPLIVDDINKLPKGSYSSHPPYLQLRNLHILRCELQYANSIKLRKVSDFIFKKKNSEDLRLSTLLDLQREQNLYNTLGQFYINELRTNVFFDELAGKEIKQSKYEKLFAELIKGKSATRLLGMYQGSQKKSLSQVIKKVQLLDNENYLYNELYQKLITPQSH